MENRLNLSLKFLFKQSYFLGFILVFLSKNLIAAAPVNDDPCNAIVLTPFTSCSFLEYTNASATASSGVPAPGCALYSGGDVWFKVVVPLNGTLNIDTKGVVLTDGGMAIYSGTCNALTLLACDDDSSPNGLMPYISSVSLALSWLFAMLLLLGLLSVFLLFFLFAALRLVGPRC